MSTSYPVEFLDQSASRVEGQLDGGHAPSEPLIDSTQVAPARWPLVVIAAGILLSMVWIVFFFWGAGSLILRLIR